MAATAEPGPPEAPHTPQTTEPYLPPPFQNTVPPPILIIQGAEALLYRTHFLSPDIPAALKVRPSKPYRHPTLDARLTKQRVLAEARVLVKLSALDDVKVPAVLSLDWELRRRGKGSTDGPPRGGAWLMMEWIEGTSVKDLLWEWDAWAKSERAHVDDQGMLREEEEVKKLLRRIGRAVAALHSKGGVIHGDLTTSNIMIRPGHGDESRHVNGGEPTNGQEALPRPHPPHLDGEIVLIDFGLATQSIQDEDRAVDLYVLERAFASTHPRQEKWFDAEVLQSQQGYRGGFKGANVVLKRLEEVRLRGRKRSMVG